MRAAVRGPWLTPGTRTRTAVTWDDVKDVREEVTFMSRCGWLRRSPAVRRPISSREASFLLVISTRPKDRRLSM